MFVIEKETVLFDHSYSYFLHSLGDFSHILNIS